MERLCLGQEYPAHHLHPSPPGVKAWFPIPGVMLAIWMRHTFGCHDQSRGMPGGKGGHKSTCSSREKE